MFHTLRSWFLRFRFAPVIAWSLSAFLISVGVAVHDLHSAWRLDWRMLVLVLAAAFLWQSVAVQAWRRQARWRSEGTVVRLIMQDNRLPRRHFNNNAHRSRPTTWSKSPQMLWLTLSGLLATVSLGIYAAKSLTGSVWLCALIGAWWTLSYICHPLRGVPLLFEWLAAFPAMLACTLGTYFLLTETWEPVIAWAAVLHSLLCVAWLMQVQLKEVTRGRWTRRRTTVAFVAKKWGLPATRHLAASYFLLAAFVGTLATLRVSHVFFFTVLCALLGAFSAWNTHLERRQNIIDNQIKTVILTLLHGLMLSLWVAWM